MTVGIGAAVIAFVLIKSTTGRVGEVRWLLWIVGARQGALR
jgi:xanthine/uracil/vitamin C permease (AzgA family)